MPSHRDRGKEKQMKTKQKANIDVCTKHQNVCSRFSRKLEKREEAR